VLAISSASGDPSMVCSVIFSLLHPDFKLERSTAEVLFGSAAERQRRHSAASAGTGCDSLLFFFTCSIEGATVSRGLVLLKKFQLPQPFIFCQAGGNLVSSK
jgi:hypothetical protein